MYTANPTSMKNLVLAGQNTLRIITYMLHACDIGILYHYVTICLLVYLAILLSDEEIMKNLMTE
jgi:hypothetical protein